MNNLYRRSFSALKSGVIPIFHIGMKNKLFKYKVPTWLKLVIKFLILAVIIYLIVRKIDEKTVLNLIRDANLWWLIWTLIFFALSKFIAALRFNTLLRTEGIRLSTWANVRLYWLCMYYNLLLPGGISGDGYKIKVLMEQFNKPFKRLFAITLLDRISGVIALGQLGLALLFFIPLTKVFCQVIIMQAVNYILYSFLDLFIRGCFP